MIDYTSVLIFVVIIIFIIGRRALAARRGTKYSIRSIFITPVIYVVLSLFLMVGLAIWQIGIMIIALIAGIFVGFRLGNKSGIFEKDGQVMYKRSNEVLSVWIVAFAIRIAVDFFTNPYLNGSATNSTISNSSSFTVIFAAAQANPIVFVADILLAFSAGLLLGEAIILRNDYNSKYKK